MTGATPPVPAPPTLWTNQYDLKLLTIGLARGYDTVVVRGESANRSFSVVYLRDGVVVALDGVNAMKDYAQGKALVQRRAVVDPAALTGMSVSMNLVAPRPNPLPGSIVYPENAHISPAHSESVNFFGTINSRSTPNPPNSPRPTTGRYGSAAWTETEQTAASGRWL
ncbi:oxidoreductase C-terminal domain-containing protein [Streptomyces solisilvae]|uniref:oxidoreductase C-terminal domain-containing protein n=1 Tax=Streptomyces malaysiensis TaxID=92644 RepID=UPI00369D80C6